MGFFQAAATYPIYHISNKITQFFLSKAFLFTLYLICEDSKNNLILEKLSHLKRRRKV